MHPRSKLWHLLYYIIVKARDKKEVMSKRAIKGSDALWTNHKMVVANVLLCIAKTSNSQKA